MLKEEFVPIIPNDLKENCWVTIDKFDVAPVTELLRFTLHDFRIVFRRDTCVEKMELSFSRNYRFCTGFEDIHAGLRSTSFTVGAFMYWFL